ncbi:hypothetical protein LCGC14_0634300 [marine sediment metagenome]|uniref:Uncharacterized protein n=1 Tax=marine sediment metagenome TaxID=412755 RepID=A0A0F9U9H7_9ZZZZ
MDKNFSENVLEVERVCAAALLRGEMFSYDTKVDVIHRIDLAMDGMMLKITRVILGEDITEIKHPADWWQASKERWFPARLQRRWPVRYKVFQIKRLYPDMVLPHPFGRSFSVIKEKDLVSSG